MLGSGAFENAEAAGQVGAEMNACQKEMKSSGHIHNDSATF